MGQNKSLNNPTNELQMEVVGFDLVGVQFIERTQILTISREGATICLTSDLAPESELIVRNPTNNKEAVARVVGLIQDDTCFRAYGIEFVDPSTNPWQMESSSAPPEKSISMECSRCHRVEIVSLSDIETRVFKSEGALTRHCACVNSSTIWKQTDRKATKNAEIDPRQETSSAEASPKKAGAERRRTRRTAMNIPASIRFAGQVVGVECEDVSLGGFRFHSWKSYPAGTRIEASVSFARSSVDIFLAGRIAYQEELPGGLYRYGVAYVTTTARPDAWA